MQDNTIAFLAGPAAFIAAHPIVLNDIAPGGIPAVNNLRTRFTLSTATAAGGLPAPGALPMLRMQPVGGPAVVAPPGGGALTTIDALYCRAGNGGDAFNALPYCDIAIAPGGADAHTLFTTGMNGCSLVVASAVPAGAPAPLAPGHLRVLHDHDHRTLAAWQAAGYTVRFAAYVDGAVGAGAAPPAWAVAAVVADYNPHNYPFGVMTPQGMGVRVVTNFLQWTGAHWTFNSRHYVAFAATPYDLDAVPPGGASSTQSLPI
ncbi:MAG: hypothetical protein MUF76_03935 [Hydrogenophaga sp.]|jgi:hypothetical protein|nr:hypothetical protein [Hydrogenophaga sp.]